MADFRWHINRRADGAVYPLARLDVDTPDGVHSYACRIDLGNEFASEVTHLSENEVSVALAELTANIGDAAIIAPSIPPDLTPKTYKDKRVWAYPPISDQFDMIWHDMQDGGTRFKDAIAAVKSQYPKE